MQSFDTIRKLTQKIDDISKDESGLLPRIAAEIDFAWHFAGLFPELQDEWRGLVARAAELVSGCLSSDGCPNLASGVAQAEEIMSPIGKAAKEYKVHCCGHAHIDMNWLWPWQETVSATHDTFATADKLMDIFPNLNFCQSQASTYAAMEQYCPEIFEMINRRMAEGRWEVTAGLWVEGDKNLASGEILCRHMLYTKLYLRDHLGLSLDSVKIGFEPDTFGHAHTIPAILTKGGLTRYYHARGGPDKWLTWWKSPDGSKILKFYDKLSYNKNAELRIANAMVDYVKETGLKDFMLVYGIGDHGGGPSKRDLKRLMNYHSWPVYPSFIPSSTDAYFTAVENAGADLPVVDEELNPSRERGKTCRATSPPSPSQSHTQAREP